MLKFKLKTYIKKNNFFNKYYDNSSKSKIVLFFNNSNDKKLFFINFVILDFKNKEIKYLISYSKINIEILKLDKDFKNILGQISKKPHQILEIKENESFYLFMENSKYLIYVNYKTKEYNVLLGKDISGIDKSLNIINFGSTPFKNSENQTEFYFSASAMKDNQYYIYYFKSSIDLKNVKEIYVQESLDENPPHSTRDFRGVLFNLYFTNAKYEIISNKKTFIKQDLYKYIFLILYKDFCKSKGLDFNIRKFKEDIIFGLKGKDDFFINTFPNIVSKDFYNFYKKILKSKSVDNFLDFCDNTKFKFKILKGEFIYINLETLVEEKGETTFGSPAHIEIGEDNCIYVSNHHFSTFDKFCFIGEAAIDKFKLEDGKLTKINTFSNVLGYRFASHKVFSYKNKEYLCTIGHPNRLFIIGTDNMEVVKFYDIYFNYVDKQDDLKKSLNNNEGLNLEDDTILAMEISENGRYIFIISPRFTILIYDISINKIIDTFDYKEDKLSILSDNRLFTVHCNYLK